MLRYSAQSNRQRWSAAVTLATCMMSIISVGSTNAHTDRRLASQDESRRLGLKRAWYAQVRLDRSRNHVESAVLVGDRLSVLTSAGVLQEFNALTGETLWIAPIGNPDYPSLGPAGNEKLVAALNGSTLYVLDRTDGRPVKIQQVGGAPGAAAGVSSKFVFVPLITGRMEGYPLEEKALTPWYYQSSGKAMVAPLITPESFVWTTDTGRLYVGRLDNLGMRYRLETGSEIAASAAYGKPFVYVATVGGEVFAMHELTGARRWRYAAGYPVMRSPAAIEDRVFVTSDEPALHCIDAIKGSALWEAPSITQFAARSRGHVYCVDELGQLVALDADTGTITGRLPMGIATHALVNDQSDRIYLVSQDGLLQCLHEIEAEEPLYHTPATTDKEQPAEATTPAQPESAPPAAAPPVQPKAEDEGSPFEDDVDQAPAPKEENPFGAEDEDPFDF